MLGPSLEVPSHDGDDFFGRFLSFGARPVRWIQQMKTHMALENFSHERIHRAPARRQRQKDRRTVLFIHERRFNRVELAPNTSNSVQQLLFCLDSVSHNDKAPIQDGMIYPWGYMATLVRLTADVNVWKPTGTDP